MASQKFLAKQAGISMKELEYVGQLTVPEGPQGLHIAMLSWYLGYTRG